MTTSLGPGSSSTTISGTTRLAAVLGDPVAHTKSPAMLNAAFAHAGIDAVLVPLHVAPPDLATVVAGLRALRLLGASVTIPHKVAIAALCDDLADDARAIGAVNCLQFDGGRLVGHNTDAGGFVDGLRASGHDPAGRRTVVLGAGGAARAIAYGLAAAGATVTVIARRPADVSWVACRPWSELGDAFAASDLVVDTTPADLDVPLERLPTSALVASLVYYRETAILAAARARGLATHDGAAMLVHQGARAFRIWTGRDAPVDAMMRALRG